MPVCMRQWMAAEGSATEDALHHEHTGLVGQANFFRPE